MENKTDERHKLETKITESVKARNHRGTRGVCKETDCTV